MEVFFREGLGGQELPEEDSDEESDDADPDNEPDEPDNPKTHDALLWADKFIFDTRRKGGRQTEQSVLKLWKVM